MTNALDWAFERNVIVDKSDTVDKQLKDALYTGSKRPGLGVSKLVAVFLPVNLLYELMDSRCLGDELTIKVMDFVYCWMRTECFGRFSRRLYGQCSASLECVADRDIRVRLIGKLRAPCWVFSLIHFDLIDRFLIEHEEMEYAYLDKDRKLTPWPSSMMVKVRILIFSAGSEFKLFGSTTHSDISRLGQGWASGDCHFWEKELSFMNVRYVLMCSSRS